MADVLSRRRRTGDGARPGDLNKRQFLDRLVRVDHAGEFGAQRIYAGQIAVLGHTAEGPILRHMADQEQEHLDYFADQLVKRRIRPTALHPFWHVAGFALGAGTALMGKRAAMACTIAVEEEIDKHYQKQLDALGDDEPDLKAKIEKFRADELEHRDIGIQHEGEQAPGYPVLSGAIRAGCRAAIWIAERV